jgi:hypothetical protein
VDNTNLNSIDRHSDFSIIEMKCNSDTDCNSMNVNGHEGTMNLVTSIPTLIIYQQYLRVLIS